MVLWGIFDIPFSEMLPLAIKAGAYSPATEPHAIPASGALACGTDQLLLRPRPHARMGNGLRRIWDATDAPNPGTSRPSIGTA